MIQRLEAIYSNGVLKPVEALHLREAERVRITVEPLEASGAAERNAALNRFLQRTTEMKFNSNGAYPARHELHERG